MKSSETMTNILSKILRYGVTLSASVIGVGVGLFLIRGFSDDSATLLIYYRDRVPHGNFDISLPGILAGSLALKPFSMIELGFLILLATPVARVAFSIFLFAVEGDRTYVYITFIVFLILLFSILVTPLLPWFGA